MCRELRALRQSISKYAATFDAHALVPSQAGDVVKICSKMEASISSIKALAMARAAEGAAWKHQGYRSPTDQMAQEGGMSPGRAKKEMETGQRMLKQPDVAQAALSGELSSEQAAAVADGAAANPGKAKELIQKAKDMSIPELNDEVARIKAAATDLEARRRRHHDSRSLRRWTDREGAGHAHLYGNPESSIALWQALDPIRRHLVLKRRDSDQPRERFEALDHDALVILASLAAGQDTELSLKDLLDLGLFPQLDPSVFASRDTNPTPSRPARDPDVLALLQDDPPPPPREQPGGKQNRSRKVAGRPIKIIVRVDIDVLLRGYPFEGELCDIPGHGQVPVSLIEELMAAGNVFLAAALTQGTEIRSIYHHGRRPNAHQQTALELLFPECTVKGCNVRHGLQYDHREDWARTHYTVLDLLDALCVHHHRLKTHKGWALLEGSGKREFVPPDDPRHPRNTKPTGADPPAPAA